MHILDGISSIDELTIDNQRIFIRADLDMATGKYASELTDLKLNALMPTLNFAAEREARIIIAAHRGGSGPAQRRRRPTGNALSLEVVGERLSQLSDWEVFLPDDCLSDSAKRVIADLRSGQVCLLENLRWHPGEVDNDEQFARGLKEWCDVYVNEALACSTERHASMVALPRLVPKRAAGLLLHKELTALSKFTQSIERPALAILGGASTSRRLDLLETLLLHADTVCIGGALSMTLLHASGHKLGQTPIAEDLLARCRSLLDQHHGRIQLPVDIVCSGPGYALGKPLDIGNVSTSQRALDIGPETVSFYAKLVAEAKTIMYTGLMSVQANDDAETGSLALLGHVARARGFSIVTGNESALTLKRGGSELSDGIDHVSLGADATLAFIAGTKLPGIDALRGASNE